MKIPLLYRITPKSHWQHANLNLLISLCIPFAAFIYFDYKGLHLTESIEAAVLYTSIVVSFLYIAPSLYLHVEYYLKDRDKSVFIDYKKSKMVIKGHASGTEESVYFHEIRVVEKHWREDIMQYLSSDNYHYFKFILADGRELSFSSLLMPDLPPLPTSVKALNRRRALASMVLEKTCPMYLPPFLERLR